MATLAQIADELGSSPAALAREAIIGSPASIIATTLAEMKGSLAEMGLSSSAAALASMRATILPEDLLSMRATIPEDTLAGLRVSVSDLLPAVDYRAQLESMGAALGKPAELAASLTRELGTMHGLADNQQARYFLEQLERDDRRSRQMAMQTLEEFDRAELRKLIEPSFIDRAIWPGPEQLADLCRQLEQPYDVSAMADALSARQAPAAISRWPAAPAAPAGEQSEPGIAPADWRGLVDKAIALANAKAVAGYAREQSSRRSSAPTLEELKEVYDTYNDLKPTKTANEIAMRLHMSTAKLYRWLDEYEERTANNENS